METKLGYSLVTRVCPKTVIVLPAYNAEKTLEKTFLSIPEFYRKNVLLVDDCSKDQTIKEAKRLGILSIKHNTNRGYGANQKTCYIAALVKSADIIVMLHPDFQYIGEDIPRMIEPIILNKKDFVIGSRIRNARKDAMPLWKYMGNRLLTIIEKIFLGNFEIHEFHSGFRAYSAKMLKDIDFLSFKDDFSFDSQMIFTSICKGYRIGEIDTRTRYFEDMSSIKFKPAFKYGLETLYFLVKIRFFTKV